MAPSLSCIAPALSFVYTVSMYFFHDRLVEYVLEAFRAADFNDAADADRFFGLFAPGNTAYFAERPFERFSDYEELLLRLMAADVQKYQRIHKGTPLYFMSWLAFDLRNYEKALFYIDAGISEDVRKDPAGWQRNPGARFLLLDPAEQGATRTVLALRRILQRELERFNQISNLPALEVEGSWRTFVSNLLADPSQRTIVSALYVFLLEFLDRKQELAFREGSTGGSNQPFTVHLFTGGLLFESLLKLCYPTNDAGDRNCTLGGVLHTGQFLRDFSLAIAPPSSANTLQEIHDAIQGGSVVEAAFGTAARLRNTTGHNLVWDDIFSTPQKYVDLFHQVMNALFFVIAGKLT